MVESYKRQPVSLIDVLGSTPRLKIIRELSHGPRYVSELTEAVGMDGKTAAHHLSTLEDSGIVEYYRRGNRKYYRLVRRVELEIAPPPERTFILQATERPDAASGDD
ncbi:ArsR family transcriptional regulator [Halalkalicoccus jeotgali B3]|uniref:ArsR family transcriptional regulator n=1 Tax=Halalkalicoccus jeotgali (strain DSM 18796 / CECT 7217 / JCM 14584 / KCTC 4019 / B3) TaxID=795797 RepID=D8J9C8_HALJB|nr:transcriptional regulator, ArsR family protein [Halalkalicoccus jeotgali B3]ELY40603.1 ArsR family transcriptional regulator [Halalkalicoccus jeotgali B3]